MIQVTMQRGIRGIVWLLLPVLAGAVFGCAEMCKLLLDEERCPFTSGDPISGAGSGDVVSPSVDPGLPRVQLVVDLATPQVGDMVTFRCSVVSGSVGSGVVFDFEPGVRLNVDHVQGIATFMVESYDIGIDQVFTCRAMTVDGVAGPVSNMVHFIPTDSALVPAVFP